MKKHKVLGLAALATTFLLAGCSSTVETGPVPTISPRPTEAVTATPTPPPAVTEAPVGTEPEDVYTTKKFKAEYEKTGVLPQLCVAYQDYFTFGIDPRVEDITDEKRQALVKQQFNALSCNAVFKFENIMDYDATRASGDLNKVVLDFSDADVVLKFAKENNLTVRGPRLITYDAPGWFFSKNFSKDEVVVEVDTRGAKTETVDLASADVMSARMDNLIKDIITYCNTNYPGVIVSWDVLDDPINSGEYNDKKYRESSNWFRILGEDYMFDAFELADKYATKEQKLFVAQESTQDRITREPFVALVPLLKEKCRLDGIAIQAHYNPNTPKVFDAEDMFKALSAFGLEIHLTEFYVDSKVGAQEDYEKTEEEFLERNTKRYKALMQLFTRMEDQKGYDITHISMDGLTDDTSSLNAPKEYVDKETGETVVGVEVYSFPYLFKPDLSVHEAFFAALGNVD